MQCLANMGLLSLPLLLQTAGYITGPLTYTEIAGELFSLFELSIIFCCSPRECHVTICHSKSYYVTLCHSKSHLVTLYYSKSQYFTLCHFVSKGIDIRSHCVTVRHIISRCSHYVTLCHSNLCTRLGVVAPVSRLGAPGRHAEAPVREV